MTESRPLPGEDEPAELAVDIYDLARQYPTAPLAWLGSVLGATDPQVALTCGVLAAQGWVRRKPGGRNGWVAAAPDAVALEAVSRRRAAAAARAAERAGSLAVVRETVGEYVDGRCRPTTTSGVEIITTLHGVRDRLDDRLRRASVSRTLHETGTAEGAEVALPHDLAALDRGLHDVTVVQADTLSERWAPPYLGALQAAGAEIRVADLVPLTMKLYDTGDDATAVVPLDPADLDRGCIVVDRPSLVRPLRELVDHHQSIGRPLVARPAGGPRRPEIVRLMSAGLTDQAIATRLGVSLRTVSREVVELMRENGAGSRFQLGLLLSDGSGAPRLPHEGG